MEFLIILVLDQTDLGTGVKGLSLNPSYNFITKIPNALATAIAKIAVGGSTFRPYRVRLEQRFDHHHRFEVTIANQKAAVTGGDVMSDESTQIDNAVQYVGESIEISIERPVGSLLFKGIVTEVQLDQTYAGKSSLIFKGYSPTYLLDAQPSVATFEEQDLNGICQKTTEGFPANVPFNVQPQYSNVIPYVVRYKETQYAFLKRMAATYGEWFLYDGQQILFGELTDSKKISLKFGSDSMLSFNYGLSARSSSFKQLFYKYEDNAVVEHSSSSYQAGDSYISQAHDVSEGLFTEEGIDPVHRHVEDQSHIRHLTESKKAGLLSNQAILSGQSADPRIAVSGTIEIDSQKGAVGGEYLVISAIHTFDPNREYHNMFRAIPVDNMLPPTNHTVREPMAEPQIAEVTDNNDPDQMGRVSVRYKWEEGETPWIRVQTNHAGAGAAEGVAGTYFIPEIGDEVLIEYEHNDPARPYVAGSFYHGKIAPEFSNPDNYVKAIKTISGHKLVFDDTEGEESILITDKNGNLLKIETNGDEITINAGNHITIKAGTSIAMEAGQTISLKSADSISLSSGDINVVANKAVNVNASSNYSLMTKNKMETVSSGTMLRTKNWTTMVEKTISSSAETINHTAKKNINSKAKKNIVLSADSKLDQRGGSVDVKAKKGKVRVNAKGNTELKGKQVKSN